MSLDDTPVIHPMVEYLNSLRTQEKDANPTYVHENRKIFLDILRQQWPWFPTDEELHVQTKLDAVANAIHAGTLDAELVFLTGDAGDGKTALCARLAAMEGIELKPITLLSGWRVVKDASEISEEELRGLISDRLGGRSTHGLLVAINEGRLRRIFRKPFEERPGLWEHVVEPSLRSWLDAEGAGHLDEALRQEKVLVLNFRHRFHVRHVLPQLLTAWTAPRLWEESPSCRQCPARQRCPILANAHSLRSGVCQENLADMLTHAHFSGQRLPFRRLQALLAAACTGGLKCRDVQADTFAAVASGADLLRFRYYEVLFPADGLEPLSVGRELLSAALAPVDPGRVASRDFDTEVWSLATPDGVVLHESRLAGEALPPIEKVSIESVRNLTRDDGAGQLPRHVASLTRSLRRWAAFETRPRTARRSWRLALGLLESYARGEDSSEELLRKVVEGLNRFHGLEGKSNSLSRRQVDPGGFRDPERLALELELGTEFEVTLSKGPVIPEHAGRWLESTAAEVFLEAWPTGTPDRRARLQLDVRLVGALLEVLEGYTHLGVLGPYRRDLARFFSRLVGLAREAGHEPHVGLRVERQLLRAIVSPARQGERARLRFVVDGGLK